MHVLKTQTYFLKLFKSQILEIWDRAEKNYIDVDH